MLRKHASYKGFIGVKAVNNAGEMAGFAYGYTSLPGQFYRMKLEAVLTEQQRKDWLDDCFEFVELAVHPNQRKNGIGSLLHDKLMQNITHETAILTTDVNNLPAKALYRKKGWGIIQANAAVISPESPQSVFGKRILRDDKNGKSTLK
ncbi:GNAT family N-acetyltransferase [Tigheibacillus jepli]